MAEIKKSHDWEKPKRHALTEVQQTSFVDYVANHKQYSHWLPVLTVLLGTGCRVGEVVGLRWEDCDFENNTISVNHNLIYRIQDNGKCEFHITTPKTKSGIRMVPMLSEVKKHWKMNGNVSHRPDSIRRRLTDTADLFSRTDMVSA